MEICSDDEDDEEDDGDAGEGGAGGGALGKRRNRSSGSLSAGGEDGEEDEEPLEEEMDVVEVEPTDRLAIHFLEVREMTDNPPSALTNRPQLIHPHTRLSLPEPYQSQLICTLSLSPSSLPLCNPNSSISSLVATL